MTKNLPSPSPRVGVHVPGLRTKFSTLFVLQVAIISFSAILGVYASAMVMHEILVKQTLRDEARHFWNQLDAQPGFPTPDTSALHGYLQSRTSMTHPIPPAWQELEPGFHELPDAPGMLALVDMHRGDKLWLLINQDRINILALYFGLIPVAAVLVVLYLSAWLLYRLSSHTVSPIVWLAQQVKARDPKCPERTHMTEIDLNEMPGEVNHEVLALAQSIHDYEARHRAMIERERSFTRDASHELRSPLTVIRVASELITQDDDVTAMHSAARRITRACNDMDALTSAFLLLARESDSGLMQTDVEINAVVDDEVERVRALMNGENVALSVIHNASPVLHTAPQVISVIIGNLLRNACAYTDQGRVRVIVDTDRVTVDDTGVGMSPEQIEQVFDPYYRAEYARRHGHGVGLTIVKRLSDRYHWPIEIDSRLHEGTRVTVVFKAKANGNP